MSQNADRHRAQPQLQKDEPVRIDKWLWAARCFKTRTLASQACDGGHVKIEDKTVKASRRVRIGETVDVFTHGGRRVLKVVKMASRRGPAKVAATLYEDLTPPEVKDPAKRFDGPDFVRDPGSGRPTKRDRRKLRRDRGKW